MSTPVSRVVHLMRHGEPLVTGLMLGRTDIDVTPQGIAACVAQAADIASLAIVSSDLVRARRCADAIGGARGLAVTLDRRWRELDFGAWDGLAAGSVDPQAAAEFWRDPETYSPPGGERWSALIARVAEALTACGDATLVVTHAGAIRAALAIGCGLSVAQIWAFDLPYSAVVTLRLWQGDTASAQIVRLRP